MLRRDYMTRAQRTRAATRLLHAARSFVPHFAHMSTQRISTACVIEGAKGILKGIRKMRSNFVNYL